MFIFSLFHLYFGKVSGVGTSCVNVCVHDECLFISVIACSGLHRLVSGQEGRRERERGRRRRRGSGRARDVVILDDESGDDSADEVQILEQKLSPQE